MEMSTGLCWPWMATYRQTSTLSWVGGASVVTTATADCAVQGARKGQGHVCQPRPKEIFIHDTVVGHASSCLWMTVQECMWQLRFHGVQSPGGS